MSESEESSSPVRRGPWAVRWRPLALIVLVAMAAVAVLAVVVGSDDPLDLRDGVGAEEVGQDVTGSDLTITDTIQDVGFFVDTDAGPVFVYYGDATDRFGEGTTIAGLAGEVAPVTDEFLDELSGQAEPEQLERLAGYDVFVRAEDITVAALTGT